MALIGVRELREQAAEVIRKVREERTEYVITYQGRPVAVLLPINESVVEETILESSKETAGDPWKAFLKLRDELRDQWPENIKTQDLLDDIRDS